MPTDPLESKQPIDFINEIRLSIAPEAYQVQAQYWQMIVLLREGTMKNDKILQNARAIIDFTRSYFFIVNKSVPEFKSLLRTTYLQAWDAYNKLKSKSLSIRQPSVVNLDQYFQTSQLMLAGETPEQQYKALRQIDCHVNPIKYRTQLLTLLTHAEVTDTLKAKIYFQLIYVNLTLAMTTGQPGYLTDAQRFCQHFTDTSGRFSNMTKGRMIANAALLSNHHNFEVASVRLLERCQEIKIAIQSNLHTLESLSQYENELNTFHSDNQQFQANIEILRLTVSIKKSSVLQTSESIEASLQLSQSSTMPAETNVTPELENLLQQISNPESLLPGPEPSSNWIKQLWRRATTWLSRHIFNRQQFQEDLESAKATAITNTLSNIQTGLSLHINQMNLSNDYGQSQFVKARAQAMLAELPEYTVKTPIGEPVVNEMPTVNVNSDIMNHPYRRLNVNPPGLADDDDMVTLKCLHLTGRKNSYRVNRNMTIFGMKNLFWRGVDPTQLSASESPGYLVHAGIKLQENRTVRDYQFNDGQVIHYALRLSGD